MSYDFYLLPSSVINSDPVLARNFLSQESQRFATIAETANIEAEIRKRVLAETLLKMKPDYRELYFDYAAIAAFEDICVEDARRKYRFIEINGTQSVGIQFHFCDNYAVVHCHFGIASDELDAILYSLCMVGDYVVFDPQKDKIQDIRK